MDVALAASIMMDKRVVLHYTQGRYAGMRQIVGTCSQLQTQLHVDQLPTFVDPVDFLDHTGACSLIQVKARYVLYRETMPPPVSGRLGEFHPQQI